MRALIAFGTGRYSDPWHPLEATANALGGIVAAAGFDVRFTSDLDRALAALGDVDLLVVNATDPWRNGQTGRGAPEASTSGFADAVARGVGILAMHNSIASLRDYPLWRTLIGGDWVPGRSGHPPHGSLTVNVGPWADRPASRFIVEDEGYVYLEVDHDVDVVALHESDGLRHPLMWRHEAASTRVFYDALGHDLRSYASAEHVALIQRAALWCVRDS